MSRVLALSLHASVCLLTAGGVLAHAQVATVQDLTYPPLPAFELPKPDRTVLPNGLVIMVMEDRELPLVSVTARIRTGGLLEPANLTGVSSLTGSVLRAGGTESMAPDQLDLFLENRAASIEAGIGDDAGTASMNVLKDDFRDVLRVFADVLRRPRFDEGRLQVAKRGIEAGIARQNDDPSAIAGREFRKLMYGDESPFARQVTYASLGAITRDDLAAWHASAFHPNRIILAVHGDISRTEAVAALSEAFGDWARGPDAPVTFPEPRPTSPAGVYEVLKTDVEQSSIRMGHQGSLISTHPDYYPVQVLNEVLSGGFTSRLFSRLRTEMGLAYSVGGSVGSQFTRVAPFSMATSTRTSATVEAVETLRAEARRIISEPPTDEEIRRAKQSILNSFIFNSARTQQVLSQQLTYEYYGVPSDWLERYRAGIEKVTREDVAAVAGRYIHPDQLSILVVGPEAGRDRALDVLGSVTRLDITIPEPAPAGGAAPASGGTSDSAPSAAASEAGRALIGKAVEGMGGPAIVDGVKTYRETALVVVETPQGEMSLETAMTFALPDRTMQEISTPMGRMTMIVSPEGASMLLPDGARRDMPPSQREQVSQQVRRTPLVLLQARSGALADIAFVGDGSVGAHAVSLVRMAAGADTVTLGIEAESGYIRSVAYRGTGPTGAPADLVVEYDDFRAVEGLVIPHRRVTRLAGEAVQQVTVSRVEVNPALDPGLFSPASEAVPGQGPGGPPEEAAGGAGQRP